MKKTRQGVRDLDAIGPKVVKKKEMELPGFYGCQHHRTKIVIVHTCYQNVCQECGEHLGEPW